MMKLYNWQVAALNAIRMNSFKSTIIAGTGSGKTFLALNVLGELKQKTLIVVPTIALLDQWKKELLAYGVKPDDLGLYYGQIKQLKPVTVAVINSVRALKGLDKKFKLLIVDECHRINWNTTKNKYILLNHNFKYSLGLTATLDKTNPDYKIIIDKIGSVVYEFTTADAVSDGLLSPFEIVNHGIDLPPREKEYIARLDGDIKLYMNKFSGDIGKVVSAVQKGNRTAGKTLSLISKRRQFFNNSLPKVERAAEIIISNVKQGSKVIVFGEYQETADELYKKLKTAGIEPLVYYSGGKKAMFKFNAKQKKSIIELFKTADYPVLITVKALDEGLNVPALDVGILLGYNKTNRQAVQRMGRLLRRVKGKKATMYNLYYKNTNDFFSAKNFADTFKGVGKIRWV